MKYFAAVLFLILVFLMAFMDTERQRLLDWFDNLKNWKQWVYGALIAIFFSVCGAVALGPIIADWYYYFNP